MSPSIEALEQLKDQIRLYTLKELDQVGFGHYGGSLSIVETLAVLYGVVMKYDPGNPAWEDRDYFVLSKGHAGPALYAALYLKGFFELDFLYSLNQNGTNLPSHPDRLKTPGVDMTTGSLGQGISVATGVALSHKLSGRENYTYTLVGDGELNEGQCWEAIQFAAHHRLDHLFVFVDNNKKQLDGLTKDIIEPFDFQAKFESFGFYTIGVNGRSVADIYEAVKKGKQQDEKPVAIILDTVKGQGVTYLEEMESNHHIRPTEQDKAALQAAMLQLAEKAEVKV